MFRVPIHKIRPGMILARPIPSPQDPYRFLLERNVEIPMDFVARLKRLGVADVWVRNCDLGFLESLIDDSLTERQRETFRHVQRGFEAAMRDFSIEIDLGLFETAVYELFQLLKKTPAASFLLEKIDAFDKRLFEHCVNVSYLSIALGGAVSDYVVREMPMQYFGNGVPLHLLGLGGLLHDVGKMRVPGEILNKPGRLTKDEFRIIQRHTAYGYEMICDVIPDLAAEVVLHHHQRWNCEGYPGMHPNARDESLAPLRGRHIPIFARIAVVADVYDAATSARCYSPAKLPIQVLYEMRTHCRGFFDPVVEKAFYRIAPAFPVGQKVTLSDGAEAAVVDFNPDFPTKPKVRTQTSSEEIDLSLYSDLGIVIAEGKDVKPLVNALEKVEEQELANA